jgi:hypothetical protein
VRGLDLKSGTEWKEYCRSGRKPADIPAKRDNGYAKDGWAGMGDWLGTGAIAARFRQYRSFKQARAFVRDLKLKSHVEWSRYCKLRKKPGDIPANPRGVYLNDGWSGWGDWLGTGNIATFLRHHRSFKQARAFVRGLGLKSTAEWNEYCKSGKKPADIPANPRGVYLNDGWSDWGDWLGTGTIAPRLRQYRPFKKARAFVHGLDLKSTAEWNEYCKSGKRPGDIPANPSQTYANSGWVGYSDWLGNGRVVRGPTSMDYIDSAAAGTFNVPDPALSSAARMPRAAMRQRRRAA